MKKKTTIFKVICAFILLGSVVNVNADTFSHWTGKTIPIENDTPYDLVLQGDGSLIEFPKTSCVEYEIPYLRTYPSYKCWVIGVILRGWNQFTYTDEEGNKVTTPGLGRGITLVDNKTVPGGYPKLMSPDSGVPGVYANLHYEGVDKTGEYIAKIVLSQQDEYNYWFNIPECYEDGISCDIYYQDSKKSGFDPVNNCYYFIQYYPSKDLQLVFKYWGKHPFYMTFWNNSSITVSGKVNDGHIWKLPQKESQWETVEVKPLFNGDGTSDYYGTEAENVITVNVHSTQEYGGISISRVFTPFITD